uniref:Uncharacterized protein n=1 Tax=Acrobeloides nanus TaxID=290746 RepID=A0A914D8X2_9BILA
MFQWFFLSRYMALLFILTMYFASSIAVPEVVYPSLRRKQGNQIYSYSEKSTSASDFLQALQFRRALANYRKKRRLQENRIIVAPIDGLRVYTKEKFAEIIDGPAKYSGSSTTIKSIL